MRPFEGNHEADVAPGGNEFDTPVLELKTTREDEMTSSWENTPEFKL